MAWADQHAISESAAGKAEFALREGDVARALELYRQAAAAEREALAEISVAKPRTRGITAVSAVALAYKARDFEHSEGLAHELLASASLPEFAIQQLRDLLQLNWAQREAARAGIQFLPGDVLVSIRGGEVLLGGAPLDLIVTKMDQVTAIFFRATEMLLGRPLRRRGLPASDIRALLQPWLFQAPAGSYQFTIRIQEPEQRNPFPGDALEVRKLSETVLKILEAASTDPSALEGTVPDEAYRTAFLKLAREIAPAEGGRFSELALRDPASPKSPRAIFTTTSRSVIDEGLKRGVEVAGSNGGDVVPVLGTLRAVELDKNWLSVATEDDKQIKVTGLTDVLDDVIGPMVNKRVRVLARKIRGALRFTDIELLD